MQPMLVATSTVHIVMEIVVSVRYSGVVDSTGVLMKCVRGSSGEIWVKLEDLGALGGVGLRRGWPGIGDDVTGSKKNDRSGGF